MSNKSINNVLALVEDVLDMASKNRYSVSKIFSAHNAVFNKKDQPQSCPSCLTRRVAALRKWHVENAPQTVGLTDEQVKTNIESLQALDHNPKTGNALVNDAVANIGPDYLDPMHPNFQAPAIGVTRYPMGEGSIPLDFTPSENDALKGTIKGADGANVKAGTYAAADGTTIAVSVGNKATIKDDLI